MIDEKYTKLRMLDERYSGTELYDKILELIDEAYKQGLKDAPSDRSHKALGGFHGGYGDYD